MSPNESMPRDLPGRYGRAVAALEALLKAAQAEAIVAGGWAVWRHGYVGRVTQDVDVVVAKNDVDEIMRLASVFGFQPLDTKPGRWPKLVHKETQIDVDIIPEGGIPGVPRRPAPVPVRHPTEYGASKDSLQFINLAGLMELKLGAARVKDQADVIELIRANRAQLPELRAYLDEVHPSYAERLQQAITQADEESED